MMKLFTAALTLMVMAAKADDAANQAFIDEQVALPADLRDCENSDSTITGLRSASGT